MLIEILIVLGVSFFFNFHLLMKNKFKFDNDYIKVSAVVYVFIIAVIAMEIFIPVEHREETTSLRETLVINNLEFPKGTTLIYDTRSNGTFRLSKIIIKKEAKLNDIIFPKETEFHLHNNNVRYVHLSGSSKSNSPISFKKGDSLSYRNGLFKKTREKSK